MSVRNLLLPALALGAAGLLVHPLAVHGYSIQGGGLGLDQRDFRVFNNFADAASNDNQTPDASFPGYQGAAMAIWKANVEWGSGLHGDGSGDPHQPGGLGSGGANFDPSFQGLADGVGGSDDNIVSAITSCSPGVLGYTVIPASDGWQIRICDGAWTWDDGPGVAIGGNKDIQGALCHEFGHALGLGHSGDGSATMLSGSPDNGVSWRSIEADDIAGVQAIYGAKSPAKPTIDSLSQVGILVTVTGSNFAPSGNEVWFTRKGGSGTGEPVRVLGVPSDGSSLTVAVPPDAGPGDVLVHDGGGGFASLSNAYPFAPDPGCPAVASVEVVRLGDPPNPDALRPGATSGPIVGATWDPFVDHAAFLPGAVADFLAVSLTQTNHLSSIGTVLCGLSPLAVLQSPAPGAPFVVPIPNECAHLGLVVCTQGASFDPSAGIALTNALDVRLGSY